MRWLLLAVVSVALSIGQARAQTYIRIAHCGDALPSAGSSPGYMDANGLICTNTGGAGSVTFTVNNKGGTVSLGGTAQTLMAANPNRVGCSLQPQSGDLWFTTIAAGSAAAVQPSFFLPAPSLYTCPPGFRGAISIFGATTGQTFAGEEDTVP